MLSSEAYLIIPPPALGITDEADLMELKGTKKKKGKKIDDPDFMVRAINFPF